MDGAAVGVDHFEGALDGFGSAVAEKDALQAAHGAEAFGEGALIAVVIQIGGVDEKAGLFADDLGHAGVGVAESGDADAGDEVKVAAPGGIVEIAAFAALERERIAGVVLEQVVAFEVDGGLREVLLRGRNEGGHSGILSRGGSSGSLL